MQLHRKRVEPSGLSVLKKINPLTPRHKCLGLRSTELTPKPWRRRMGKVDGKVHEGDGVIVRRATATIECEGFKSLMVLWAKVYPVRKPRHLWRG